MSQIDESEGILSETLEEHGAINNNLKLVPVAESIRYRKRAQSAEKDNESMVHELAVMKSQNKEVSDRLEAIKTEQQLTRKLVAAGAVDLEATILVVRARMDGSEKADMDGVIEQLKAEKQHLFGDQRGMSFVPQRTSGAKERDSAGHVVLGRAAKKAATTGNRTDLQEYLKLRRNFIN